MANCRRPLVNRPNHVPERHSLLDIRSLADSDRWLGRVRETQNYRFWRYATDAMTAGVATARQGSKGGWTKYGPPSYWLKLGRSRGRRDTRDSVARKIAEHADVSMRTACRNIIPYLAAMAHHCKNHELTVAIATCYDFDIKHVAFVTGSGEDTNKIQSIVEDARELHERAAVKHSGGVFGGRILDGADTVTEETQTEDASERAGSGTLSEYGETGDGNGSTDVKENRNDDRSEFTTGESDGENEEEMKGEDAETDKEQSGLDDFS